MYKVIYPDGTEANKTWESIRDIKLSINQGRLRFAEDESQVLLMNANGYPHKVHTIGELRAEIDAHTCPSCGFSW